MDTGSDSPAFFVWEGVTQYLTRGSGRGHVRRSSHRQPSGSRLDFTYVRRDFIEGARLYGAPTLYRRMRQRSQLWKFGLLPEDVAGFLDQYGWRLIDQAGPDEMMARYIRPAGRDLTASQIEWAAYAEKI